MGIDQRRLDDQHREPGAVLAHEHRLEALARRLAAQQPCLLALLVFVELLRRPIRDGGAGIEQFLRAEADHLAERRIDVGRAALQVTRAQPGDQRILHRLAKRQRIGQLVLGAQAPAHVARQEHQHQHQADRHATTMAVRKLGNSAGVPRQLSSRSTSTYPGSSRLCWALKVRLPLRAHTVKRQPGAVDLGERHVIGTCIRLRHHFGQDVAQRISGHQVAVVGAAHRQAHLQHLLAHARLFAAGTRWVHKHGRPWRARGDRRPARPGAESLRSSGSNTGPAGPSRQRPAIAARHRATRCAAAPGGHATSRWRARSIFRAAAGSKRGRPCRPWVLRIRPLRISEATSTASRSIRSCSTPAS